MQLNQKIDNNIETEKDNYEIIKNEDGIILKYTESGNEHSININIDDEFDLEFSHSTEGIIPNGDLNLYDKNIDEIKDTDKLISIGKTYGFEIKTEDLIEIFLYMKSIRETKINKETNKNLNDLKSEII